MMSTRQRAARTGGWKMRRRRLTPGVAGARSTFRSSQQMSASPGPLSSARSSLRETAEPESVTEKACSARQHTAAQQTFSLRPDTSFSRGHGLFSKAS